MTDLVELKIITINAAFSYICRSRHYSFILRRIIPKNNRNDSEVKDAELIRVTFLSPVLIVMGAEPLAVEPSGDYARMMIVRYLRWAFVGLFAVLVCAPLAQMTLHFVHEAPLIENRRLAVSPKQVRPTHEFARSIQAWFNDNFGLRSSLVRLNTQIMYLLFRTSERVYIGRDGWLFYRGVMDVEKPNVERFLTEYPNASLAGIAAFTAALKRNGIDAIVFVNELADRVYGDFLPPLDVPPPADPKIVQLAAALGSISSLTTIDVTAFLKEIAHMRPVFHKTDYHWNDPAAFVVAQRIVAEASRVEGRASPWSHELDIKRARLSGGIADFLPLLRPVSEMAWFVNPSWPPPPGLVYQTGTGIFEYSFIIDPPRADVLKPMVLLGDSFSDGLVRSGLQNYFLGTYRVRNSTLTNLSTLAEAMPLETRHVVIQFVEVQLKVLKDFADADDVARAAAIIDRRFGVKAKSKP